MEEALGLLEGMTNRLPACPHSSAKKQEGSDSSIIPSFPTCASCPPRPTLVPTWEELESQWKRVGEGARLKQR